MPRWLLLLCALVAQPALAAHIAIDVGHSLEHGGAVSARGRVEFEFNLDLATEIANALVARGHTVRLIGADGGMNVLWRRPRAAQGAALLLSVHHDSVREKFMSTWTHAGVERRYSDLQSGFSLFVSRENPGWKAGLRCASAAGAALRNAGLRPSLYHADPVYGENRPFADKANGVHYYDHLAVLRHARMPALLLEAGVIVNRAEELKLGDPATRRQIADGVAAGVDACLS